MNQNQTLGVGVFFAILGLAVVTLIGCSVVEAIANTVSTVKELTEEHGGADQRIRLPPKLVYVDTGERTLERLREQVGNGPAS